MTKPAERAAALMHLLHSGAYADSVQSASEAVVVCCDDLCDAGELLQARDLAEGYLAALRSRNEDWAVRLSIRKARALGLLGQFEEALSLLRGLWAAYPDYLAARESEAVSIRIHEAANQWQLNRVEEALDNLRALHVELLLKPESENLGLCAFHLSSAQLFRGDYKQARRYALDAVVSARRIKYRSLEVSALLNVAMLDRQSCRWGSAIDSAVEAVGIARECGHRLHECNGIRNIAISQWKKGQLEQAASNAEASIAIAKERGSAYFEQFGVLLRSLIAIHLGDFALARQIINPIVSQAPPHQQSRPSLLTTEFLGDIHLEQGQAAEALALYDEVWPRALALVPKGDIVAELRRRRAECHFLMGRFGDAHREALTGLDHCRELGDRYEEAATYRVLALSTAAIGRPADAKKWFDQGFAYYDDIETPYEWGKLWLAYGDWLHGPHAGEYLNEKAALEAYVAAADHFEHMGAAARLAEANARIVALHPAPPKDPKGGGPAMGAAAKPRRPARKPRAQVELERRAAWAFEAFGFVTRNRGVLDLLDEVAKLATSDAPILVLGESGTGKELVANGVHRLSGRAGQFIAINCGAIPRDMIESELFGHVAGAFTGATRDKPGIFETCQNGTVFLDEVGEMSLDLQSRLLRFLERSEARRVGSNRNYSVDTRMVAATNRDRAALERGESFRPDLYYRLAHAVIVLPPLRRRSEDVHILTDHFLAEFGEVQGREVALSDAARDLLSKHTWPGNVRQLRAVLRRAVLLSTPGRVIDPAELQLDSGAAPATLLEELEAAEKARIIEALAQSRGSRTETARALGMPRTTLINKMQRHGLM